jgi:heat-inducible transcriptional repressor
VLYALVTEFIATGEPVGSRTLTKKYGFDLSPATIRNELKDLEDEGFLAQPHTSAGRVPTARAFRVFIDALMRVRELPTQDASRIRELFDTQRPGPDLLRETAKLLSDLSGAPAVLLQARSERRRVQTLRFVPTRPGELLSVLVMSDGTVENRFIHVDGGVDASQLERVHNLLDEVVVGRTLLDLRDHLNQLAREQRDELHALQKLGESLLNDAVEGADRSKDLIIEGVSRLVDGPSAVDAERLRGLMLALEDKEELLKLLDRILESSDVQVFLGEEASRTVGHPLSVVAAPFQRGGAAGGALGVVGPARMDYPFLVPLVGTTAAAMSRALTSWEWDRADGSERSVDEDAGDD